MEEQKRCFYLDSSFQPASDMLRTCVGDKNTPYRFNCEEDPMGQVKPEDVKETARMNDISIQRGFSYYNVDNHNVNNFQPVIKKSIQPIQPIQPNNVKQSIQPIKTNNYLNQGMEGFQNQDNIFITDNGLGKSSVPDGQCPEGYSRDDTGKCIQKCIGCVYRDNMKSREFNEADPCFPNGVYDGVTNNGDIKCTCGRDNKYCSEDFIKKVSKPGGFTPGGLTPGGFTPDGMLIVGQKIIMNTGPTKSIDDLFNFDYL